MNRPCAVAFLLLAGAGTCLGFGQSAPPQAPAILLPAGSKIELVVTRPVWAKTARAGDPIYAQTDFPVTVGQQLAIPAGAWVEGTIEEITRPTRRSSRAELEILFTEIIFADGYAVSLPDVWPVAARSPGSPVSSAVRVTVEARTSNDLLLDNGAQMEMTVAMPVELDAGAIADAIPLTQAPAPGSFQTATLCRPTSGTPGTPGTPDTVIPGTPGTPSTTIPGGPGMPDITIPGTPGTPPTAIPGTPGTPGTPGSACPPAPIVVSSTPITAVAGTAGATPAKAH